jgi:hypothetical protein
MPDQMTLADRYRKVAAESAELAKNASSDFLRRYYEGLAERYLLLAERELAVAERQRDAAPLQPSSSGEGHVLSGDPVALMPPPEIGGTMSGEETEKVVDRPDGPQTVAKGPLRGKKRPRPDARGGKPRPRA